MNYFITTTLPYANSTPHVGHLLEFVQGDAIARTLRGRGDVCFNVGLDEHGLKIQRAAEAAGNFPLDYVDKLARKWLDFCHLFDIKWDKFYRTSCLAHYYKVQEFWEKLESENFITKKQYKGKYCVGCEWEGKNGEPLRLAV